MGKTFTDVMTQVRELIGDYQSTTFTDKQVGEAINWAQDLVIRIKGFKVATRLYNPTTYPTGSLPSDWLVVKRMQLVTNTAPTFGVDSSDVTDVVIRILDPSEVGLEDSNNERWRSVRPSYLPRRWTLIGGLLFSIVPPLMPTDGSGAGMYVRLHYIKRAVPVDYTVPTSPVDASIPDYYQEALRYAAVAYLLEKDTDLKSLQLKGEMMKAFDFHLAGGVVNLAQGEQDA
jgi:hypothetical protein